MEKAIPPVEDTLPSDAFLAAGESRNAGKPLETMGRKARGWGAGFRATLVRLRFGKPSETVGRQSQRLRCISHYARSATGYFASDDVQRKEVIL